MKFVRSAAENNMCGIELLRKSGAAFFGPLAVKRLLPLLLAFAFFCALLVSQAFVWDIEVTGNESVATGEILSALRDCGVYTGSCWIPYSSDNIRSQAIERIPELLWLTVNISGSRASVIVREKTMKPELVNIREPVDIISKKDAFIMSVRTLFGEALVKPGQAVREGDILISSQVQDINGGYRAVHAMGDISARTYYELSAACRLESGRKSFTGKEKRRWALEIGGKRVNFYRNSSIFDSDCDKIYSEYSIGIDGLFTLPLTIVSERSIYYELTPDSVDVQAARTALEQELFERLRAEIDGGEIISQSCVFSIEDGKLTACLRAECQESIGVFSKHTGLGAGEGN